MNAHYIACAVSCVAVAGCWSTTPIKAVSDEMEKAGYTVYNPPRTDHGPGWVFRFAKTFDGKTVPATVCVNLYPEDRVVDSRVSFPNVQRTDTAELSFALGLLEGLVKNVQKASVDLSAKSVKTITIKWGALTAKELPEERRFTDQGTLVPISQSCSARLRELRTRNQLDGVYVVQSAVRAETMLVSADADRNSGLNLDVSLYKALDVKPGAKVSEKSTSTIEVTEPRYVGFTAIALIDFAPTDQYGADSATVKGQLLPREKAEKLLGQSFFQ